MLLEIFSYPNELITIFSSNENASLCSAVTGKHSLSLLFLPHGILKLVHISPVLSHADVGISGVFTVPFAGLTVITVCTLIFPESKYGLNDKIC